MDKSKFDGGFAFPLSSGTGDPRDGVYSQNGMSLRDWFAVSAQQDDLSLPVTIQNCADYIGIPAKDYKAGIHWKRVISKCRYDYADAMIEERGRT